MNAILKEQTVDDEGLLTLMCEVESIINGRPITKVSDDPKDLEALTPNHLLLLKSGITLPPGIFRKEDQYSRRRWRQVQYLADVFWRLWLKEYLPSLQARQRWNRTSRNFSINDIVLVMDDNSPRSSWPLGRILDVHCNRRDGLVRSVKVLCDSTNTKTVKQSKKKNKPAKERVVTVQYLEKKIDTALPCQRCTCKHNAATTVATSDAMTAATVAVPLLERTASTDSGDPSDSTDPEYPARSQLVTDVDGRAVIGGIRYGVTIGVDEYTSLQYIHSANRARFSKDLVAENRSKKQKTYGGHAKTAFLANAKTLDMPKKRK
ncbi:hypothetical protein QZH41_001199 [Actinostola sp. cb2023]|nr:hypothetical protein QZH41_001199 [Actinostola sp. cb2023]